jgi:uncharacterized protein YlxW (UPF0749 family)
MLSDKVPFFIVSFDLACFARLQMLLMSSFLYNHLCASTPMCILKCRIARATQSKKDLDKKIEQQHQEISRLNAMLDDLKDADKTMAADISEREQALEGKQQVCMCGTAHLSSFSSSYTWGSSSNSYSAHI